ncbi:carbohydrate-binding family 9-like protein [Pontibacter sp. XAAS-A31]|nr:carbohydrate-binding family 9-like protein [Pontibacter harenae]
MDGKLEKEAWAKATWTSDFVDIEGSLRPHPRFRTRAKMLWDDTYFYVAAEMEEPELWATLTERESVIFYDNDFEVFIDPDGDTQNYYEFEVNALGTVWDLLLAKTYRDGGPAINAWDIRGVQVGVQLNGTLNNPDDKDKKWIVEIAFPWDILKECASEGRKPKHGEQWRLNFSRVEWQTEVKDGQHVKKLNPDTGKAYPEDNWVWSPQGVVDMHLPATWGFVQFSDNVAGTKTDKVVLATDERIKWELRKLYYAEKHYHQQHKRYTTSLADLVWKPEAIVDYTFVPQIMNTQSQYEITAATADGKGLWHIRNDGKVWRE